MCPNKLCYVITQGILSVQNAYLAKIKTLGELHKNYIKILQYEKEVKDGLKTGLKDERLEFRLSKAEKMEIERKAKEKGLSMGAYLRLIIIDTPKVTYSDLEYVLNELIYQIRKIGVNINQIAKKYNEGQYTAPRMEILKYQRELLFLVNRATSIVAGWYKEKRR